MKQVKGFRWGRKAKEHLAKQALYKAWQYAFRDRKAKKRAFRRLWQIQINAALREQGLVYSKFIGLLKTKKVGLDRKMLALLAREKPTVFSKIISFVKESD